MFNIDFNIIKMLFFSYSCMFKYFIGVGKFGFSCITCKVRRSERTQ